MFLDAAFHAQIEAMTDLDILINNAGGNRPKLMIDVDDETLDWMIDLNIRSVYKVSRAAVRAMGQGSGGAVSAFGVTHAGQVHRAALWLWLRGNDAP